MAGIQVTDVTGMMVTDVTGLTSGIETGRQKVSETSDFSKMLDDANKKINVVDELSTGNRSSESTSTVVDKSATNTNKVKSDNTERKNPVDNAKDRVEAAGKIEEKANVIKDKVKESFGLTEEELTETMANLGITLQDLLNPDKLKDLLMEISGVADSISLITDADLYANVKAVMDIQNEALSDIANEFGIDTAQVLEIIEDTELFANLMDETDLLPEDVIPQESTVNTPEISIVEEIVVPETTDNNADEVVEILDNSTAKVDTVSPEQNKDMVKTDETAKVVEENHNEEINTNKEESYSKMPTSEGTGKGRNEGFENGNSFGRAAREHIEVSDDVAGQVETVTTTQTNSVGDIVETITSYHTQDSGEIVSQITESIKVNISQDTTSLEMALHPASLGTVNIQITSANGVITAQVLVENEAVKAALESQLIALQDSFEAAGHKVEAVEVSVANYDLNKGMDQEQNRNNGNKDHEDAFKVMGSRRRINLNAMEETDEEEMSEEEAIARDMMERNGNTVDYTV